MLKLVKSCTWWHHIDLGDGIITPGQQSGVDDVHFNERFLDHLNIPTDLTGKTVLDIGCSDGYYSFACEKRGAKVLAIDDPSINNNTRNFFVAKHILGSNVECIHINLFDIKDDFGEFDIVLASGLLYHLKSLYIGLEIMKRLTKEVLIIQTALHDTPEPILYLEPPKEKSWHFVHKPSLSYLMLVLEKIGFDITYLWQSCPGEVFLHATQNWSSSHTKK